MKNVIYRKPSIINIPSSAPIKLNESSHTVKDTIGGKWGPLANDPIPYGRTIISNSDQNDR